VIGFLIAMLTTMLALPPLIRLGRAARIVAVPDHRRLHAEVTPQIGGVAIVIGFAIGTLMLLPEYSELAVLYVGAAVVFGAGLMDDYRELDYRVKFVAQFAAAGWVMAAMSLWDIGFSLDGGTVRLGLVSAPIAFLFVVGVTNAINLSDGLDGLAAGLALVSGLAIGLIGYQSNAPLPLFVTLALGGSLMGFLRFNSHPARVFMGDNGAYFIGFTLASCCLLIACRSQGVSFFALLFVLGLPVYDTVSVALRRMAEGRGPFSPDRKHLHHRLLDGVRLSHDQVVLCMYLAHMMLVSLGYMLVERSEWIVGSAYAVTILLFEIGMRWLGRSNLRRNRMLRSAELRSRGWHQALDVAAFAMMVTLPLWAFLSAPHVPADFAAVAGGLLVLVGALMLRRGFWTSLPGWVDRISLYVLGTYAVYFLSSGDRGAATQLAATAAFLLLGAWLILKVVDARDRGLKLTALDVLIVAATVSVSSLGPWHINDYAVEIVKVLVWFYAVELLFLRFRHVQLVHALPLLGCGVIVARAALG
jgi:UDP-GlcNAc:undecaprenyl-phosphate GlcNAc-1-phosphate transferase